jgi:hypothetical protein
MGRRARFARFDPQRGKFVGQNVVEGGYVRARD